MWIHYQFDVFVSSCLAWKKPWNWSTRMKRELPHFFSKAAYITELYRPIQPFLPGTHPCDNKRRPVVPAAESIIQRAEMGAHYSKTKHWFYAEFINVFYTMKLNQILLLQNDELYYQLHMKSFIAKRVKRQFWQI